MPRRFVPLCFAAVLVVGAGLRLWRLAAHGLWTDELVSWWAVSAGSATQLVQRCSSCMATPPLSFLCERLAVLLLGRSEWALRLPSVACGVLTLGVVSLAGRRMFGTEAGLLAGALLAIHPFHLGFSCDARPYALAILLASLSIWAWSELAARPGRGWLALHVLSTSALLYTQFVFAPLVLAQALAYLLARRRGLASALSPKLAGCALGGALLLSLPLLPQFWGVAGRASALAWPATEEYPPWIYWFFETTPLFCALLVGVALLTFDATPRAHSPPARARFDTLSLSLSFLVPSLLLGIAAVAFRLPSLVKARYGAAYLAACVLLVGGLYARLPRGAKRRAVAFVYVFLIVVTQVVPPLLAGRSFSVDADLEGWNEAAKLLRAEHRPGDVVLLRSPLVETAQLFAGSIPSGCEGYLAAPLGDFYLPERPEVVLLPPWIEGPPYPAPYAPRVGARIAGHARIWLVIAGAPAPQEYLDAVLELARAASGRGYSVSGVHSFGLVSMALLTSGG